METEHTELGHVRVLVPLDGSALAEQALPVAERIVRALDGVLILAHALPITTWAFATPSNLIPEEPYRELLEAEERSARAYLEALARAAGERSLAVVTALARGEAGSTLLLLASQQAADLLVLTTHGRSGVRRAVLGSVADDLVRRGHVPVLVVHSARQPATAADAAGAADTAGDSRLERALVPLDGSARAEVALQLALALAGRLVHELALVRVVGRRAKPEATAAAQRYLDTIRDRIGQQLGDRDCTISTVTLRGGPVEPIRRRAQEGYDLIIMATRGMTGPRRWVLGSVADGVLRRTSVPVLLVHPADYAAESTPPDSAAGTGKSPPSTSRNA